MLYGGFSENFGSGLQTAQLPNITGTFFVDGTDGGYSRSGAFFVSSTKSDNGKGHTGSATTPVFGFDASKSDKTYADGGEVRPANYTYKVWVRTA